jgi:hypothetical protein
MGTAIHRAYNYKKEQESDLPSEFRLKMNKPHL